MIQTDNTGRIRATGGERMLNVFFARAMERVHPENELPIRVMSPISVRKVMGNETSLLHQVVHAPYTFQVEDLKKDDATLNKAYRAFHAMQEI